MIFSRLLFAWSGVGSFRGWLRLPVCLLVALPALAGGELAAAPEFSVQADELPVSSTQFARAALAGPNAEGMFRADTLAASEELRLDPAAFDWRDLERIGPNLGFRSGPVWLRFQLYNPGANELDLALVARNADTDRFVLFESESAAAGRAAGDGPVLLRRLALAGDRAVDQQAPAGGAGERLFFRTPAFRIQMAPGERRSFYVLLASDGALSADFALRTHRDFERYAFVDGAFLGVFYGSLFALFVYNAALFLVVRFRPLLYYDLYLSLVFITLLIRDGFFEQLAGEAPWISNEGRAILHGLVFFSATRFTRAFLFTRHFLGRGDRALQVLEVLCLASSALAPFWITGALQAQTILRLAATVGLLGAGIFALMRGAPDARYYVAAWSLPLAGSFFTGAQEAGLTPQFQFAGYVLPAAVMGEFLLFSIALAQRVRQLARDRAYARTRLDRLEQDLEIARRIHSRALPGRVRSAPGADIRVRYQPLFAVGGDLYDIDYDSKQREGDPRNVGLLVADVIGHGVAAALDSSTVRIAYRSVRPRSGGPRDLLQQMNDFLLPYLEGRFVSAVYAEYDLQTHRLSISSAGHPYPLVYRAAERRVEKLPVEGPLLGLELDDPHPAIETQLHPGDRLFLFTDGLYEVHNTQMRASNEPELLAVVRDVCIAEDEAVKLRNDESAEANGRHAAPLEDRLLERMKSVRGGKQDDDITLLVLSAPPSATP